ncbi:MAG: hypothetical protein SFY92_02555 [Verrucomicrobiae bacterium]|nr:hypothetical protein [Verrucomicrobiae bacterium]
MTFLAEPLIESGREMIAVGLTVTAMTLSFSSVMTVLGGVIASSPMMSRSKHVGTSSEDALFYCFNHVAPITARVAA